MQLAARAGATVIAAASRDGETYLRELGGSQVIDRDRDLALQAAQNTELDALIDLVSCARRTQHQRRDAQARRTRGDRAPCWITGAGMARQRA